MDVKRIGVVGAGQMGAGIAQVFAQTGHEVVMVDTDQAFVERGRESIEKSLQRGVEKGKVSAEEKQATLARVKGSTDVVSLRGVDFAVEAVTEKAAVKREVFRRLSEVTRPEVILATNTSSLSITSLAASTNRPTRFIGMHFMNPVPVMKLVEVIRGLATSDETCETVKRLAERLGKTPVEANDYPGFIANRILAPMINEAVYALYERVGSREAIDTVMKLGANQPMGPLALADFIGLDTCLAILEVMHEGFGDPKYRPCPLLRKYVAAGWLGRKTGRGFYDYRES